MAKWDFRNLFGRQRTKDPDIDTALPTGNTRLLPDGTYVMDWQNQAMPSPGAMSYSWETLGLPPIGIIAQGIASREPFPVFGNMPVYITSQALPLWGIPTVAGTVVQQPLIRQG